MLVEIDRDVGVLVQQYDEAMAGQADFFEPLQPEHLPVPRLADCDVPNGQCDVGDADEPDPLLISAHLRLCRPTCPVTP